MDLVTCEAPLDNSFQKDRRELVNKGSLGRRRKPSRSNLRLILSPANDQQDIDVFRGHPQSDSDGSFIQVNVSSANRVEQSVLSNHQVSVVTSDHGINSNENQFRDTRAENSHLTLACNNYREVVASINQIYKSKSIDFDDSNHQSVLDLKNRQNTVSSLKHVEINSNKQQKEDRSANNNGNYAYHSQISVTNNHQNGNVAKNHHPNGKFANEHCDIKSNGYHFSDHSKNLKITDSKTNHQVLKVSNQQKAVASKNHLNIITFSNRRQIITSSPVQSKKTPVSNGRHPETTTTQNPLLELSKESSLPRTSKEPNLVAEAQQFSIEAKLKRKKSEVQGRSAVLIQTWERRTQSESYSKLQRDCKSALKNRFSGKENSDANSTAMPDSYIFIKYKGSLQNGDKLQKDELVPNVRDVSPGETMLYRVPDERHRRVQALSGTANGGTTVNGKSHIQEPEWISLSRKLCAKFVEGHIEPHSPDSYPYEEPEGVGEEPNPSPKFKTHSCDTQKIPAETQKRKVALAALCEEHVSNSEPPWIHLSRKLCNKFIEEHIEYPPITNGHFVEVPDLVEPNGDVRIIEKVGKPKGHKSKQKKESEPEWVSLSKKLRAKFIESHIDDPDTIALDNQLNASDPEETSSETLSDVSQDISVPKKDDVILTPVECKNFTLRGPTIEHEFQEHERQTVHNGSVKFPDKECCWEYQEMEFDQESNSGNFQEPEYNDEPLQEARVRRGTLPQDASDQCVEQMAFSENVNVYSHQNPECYNNDVIFAPYFSKNEIELGTQQNNKLITVQFIAHTERHQHNELKTIKNVPHCSKNSKNDAFFNLSTWEEAHYKDDVDGHPNPQEMPINKNFLPNSLDNLCDSLEESSLSKVDNSEKNEDRNSLATAHDFDAEDRIIFNSSESVNNQEKEIFLHEFKLNQRSSSDVSSLKEDIKQKGINCAPEDAISETENRMLNSNLYNSPGQKQNIFHNKQDAELSSEDEVFEPVPRNKEQPSKDPESHYGNIAPRKSPELKKKERTDQIQARSEKVKNYHCNKNGKNIQCNGMIPNSIYDSFPDSCPSSSKHSQPENNMHHAPKEPVKLGMSKWITISKSEQNLNKPEYSNLKSTIQKVSKSSAKSVGSESGAKSKSKKNNAENKISNENKTSSNKQISPKVSRSLHKNGFAIDFDGTNTNSSKFDRFPKESDLKTKCKSLCDVSQSSSPFSNASSFNRDGSVADICSGRHTPTPSQIEFQHFEFESEIPLCAKLVSNHDKKMMSKNVYSMSPTNRNESPTPSESSHVYEDMFKETPSGPSDSEASSWVMKNNTYYINGRSSSMNDLDFSDSCSMSVKCDYASSSENSTLQSRHSSYASSSFYVNLRDYDSHMLEPSFNKGKKANGRLPDATTPANVSKSNPPTPESLRHLFTSPLSSIHSPPNRAPRLLNRMPSDPQSHYYSTAAATSSAFKHGFALNPPKPKKTERSSSIKIKDIAHGIILTFKRFQNHSKNSNVSSTQHVDVSHLAEMKSNSELGKANKGQKNSKRQNHDKSYWPENGKTDTDSGILSDVQRAKARRSSSDLTGMKSNSELFNSDKKKSKSSKKNSNRDKGKKSRSKASEPRTVPTVSRKVQQMADGTLYLVTTVSGDTTLPGVYSDSPDTSSELSSHKPIKVTGESNC